MYKTNLDNCRPEEFFRKSIFNCFLFDIFREVRTFLAEQLQPLSNEEQKEWLSNITSHIQTQGLSTPNVEIAHIELAIKVCIYNLPNKFHDKYGHLDQTPNSK